MLRETTCLKQRQKYLLKNTKDFSGYTDKNKTGDEKMKQIKLIAGQMNIPYVICKAGYAEGAAKPKRQRKTQPKPLVTKLRKQEGLIV